jgi:hypothetical protein
MPYGIDEDSDTKRFLKKLFQNNRNIERSWLVVGCNEMSEINGYFLTAPKLHDLRADIFLKCL